MLLAGLIDLYLSVCTEMVTVAHADYWMNSKQAMHNTLTCIIIDHSNVLPVSFRNCLLMVYVICDRCRDGDQLGDQIDVLCLGVIPIFSMHLV